MFKQFFERLRKIFNKKEGKKYNVKFSKKEKIKPNNVVIENVQIDKISLILCVSEWVRKNFVFRNNNVNLIQETKLPIDGVNEELTDVNIFEKKGLNALDYLITCVLFIGIKIGRDIERYERDRKE